MDAGKEMGLGTKPQKIVCSNQFGRFENATTDFVERWHFTMNVIHLFFLAILLYL